MHIPFVSIQLQALQAFMMHAILAMLPALKPLTIAISIHLCCRQHELCKKILADHKTAVALTGALA